MICRFDNCNSLLVGSPKYLFQKLQRIQNCAARLVAQLPKAARTSPILQKLHWLPVEQRVLFKALLLTYKALNNLAPVYISKVKWYIYIAPLSQTSQRRFTMINLPPADWKHIQAQMAAAFKQSMHAGTHFTDLGRIKS